MGHNSIWALTFLNGTSDKRTKSIATVGSPALKCWNEWCANWGACIICFGYKFFFCFFFFKWFRMKKWILDSEHDPKFHINETLIRVGIFVISFNLLLIFIISIRQWQSLLILCFLGKNFLSVESTILVKFNTEFDPFINVNQCAGTLSEAECLVSKVCKKLQITNTKIHNSRWKKWWNANCFLSIVCKKNCFTQQKNCFVNVWFFFRKRLLNRRR